MARRLRRRAEGSRPSPKYRVRRADIEKVADRITLIKLHADCFPWDTVPTLESTTWWIAECDKRPVGFCALNEARDEPTVGYLARAGVLKAHRGHGLQRRFLKLREAEATSLGYTVIICDTTADNVASMRNLIAEGYLPFAPEERWGLSTSTYWRKSI